MNNIKAMESIINYSDEDLIRELLRRNITPLFPQGILKWKNSTKVDVSNTFEDLDDDKRYIDFDLSIRVKRKNTCSICHQFFIGNNHKSRICNHCRINV